MLSNLLKQFKSFSVNLANEIGPEKYTEKEIGNLDSYNAVNGGGFLSSIKTEVEVNGVKYIIEGTLNGVPLGETVILRHWPKTDPKGLKYLLIDGSRFRVAN